MILAMLGVLTPETIHRVRIEEPQTPQTIRRKFVREHVLQLVP